MLLGAATTSFAADTTTKGGSASSVGDDHAKTWAPKVNDTFFTDSTGTTMRESDEVSMRWSKLDKDDQEKVKADCKDMKSDSMGGMADACKWIDAM
nr:hypothetical protein [uncultured Gellertiella sp.]